MFRLRRLVQEARGPHLVIDASEKRISQISRGSHSRRVEGERPCDFFEFNKVAFTGRTTFRQMALERSGLKLAQSAQRIQRGLFLKFLFVQFVFQLAYPSKNCDSDQCFRSSTSEQQKKSVELQLLVIPD